jgi:hypothetical protein
MPAPLLEVGDLLSPREQAAYLRISLPSLYVLAGKDKGFPASMLVTPQRPVRRRVDLDRWISDRMQADR